MGANLTKRQKTQSLVDSVFDQILALLHSRGLAGAEVLHAATLADELGVSRTPVTLALVRLESEGLVRKSTGQGWTTIPLSLENIEGIFDLKDLLEPFAARRAAEGVTPEAAADLLSVVEDMEGASASSDLEGWLVADRCFHALVHDLAGNRRLKQFQEQLNNQLYRLESGHFATQDRMAAACQEHRLVAETIAAGNPDLAAEHARHHIQNLRASIVDVVQNILMPFLGQEL